MNIYEEHFDMQRASRVMMLKALSHSAMTYILADVNLRRDCSTFAVDTKEEHTGAVSGGRRRVYDEPRTRAFTGSDRGGGGDGYFGATLAIEGRCREEERKGKQATERE